MRPLLTSWNKKCAELKFATGTPEEMYVEVKLKVDFEPQMGTFSRGGWRIQGQCQNGVSFPLIITHHTWKTYIYFPYICCVFSHDIFCPNLILCTGSVNTAASQYALCNLQKIATKASVLKVHLLCQKLHQTTMLTLSSDALKGKLNVDEWVVEGGLSSWLCQHPSPPC